MRLNEVTPFMGQFVVHGFAMAVLNTLPKHSQYLIAANPFRSSGVGAAVPGKTAQRNTLHQQEVAKECSD